jgi:hypothetical protein
VARTWLSVRVELLGGRGEDLWPYPGRVLLVGPSHTFAQLAEAIDLAFARWDRAHLCRFTLGRGTVVTDEESGMDLADSSFGPLGVEPLVLARTKVSSGVAPGDEFKYVFDFGDDWVHACTVGAQKVDPAEYFRVPSKIPAPVWGWGNLPDQYGRRWDQDGSGEAAPRRPKGRHPMLDHGWPNTQPVSIDLRELRGATHRGDLSAILAAVEGREIDDALQHVGMALQVVLSRDPGRGDAIAASLLSQLELRGLPGDEVLAEDLLAQLRRTPLAARELPVDLSELADVLEGDPVEPAGVLDLATGEVVPAALLDDGLVGDEAVDIESEPDRWLHLDRPDSREQWNDMAEFAGRQTDSALRDRLTMAIEGKGAFRRFRDVVHDEDVVEQWRLFSDDRAIGRARAYLAGHGIRVSLRTD